MKNQSRKNEFVSNFFLKNKNKRKHARVEDK